MTTNPSVGEPAAVQELTAIRELELAATSAQQAELAYRKAVAAEIERHERERQFAFRRVDLAKTMALAAAGCETRDAAIAAQIAALKSEFGWYGDNEQRKRICESWEDVADSVWRSSTQAAAHGEPNRSERTLREAMLAFEAWYLREFGRPFLALLDQEIPDFPVVEF